MSAIAGIFDPAGKRNNEESSHLFRNVLTHRAPHGWSTQRDEYTILLQGLFRTLPEDTATAQVVSQSGAALVADVRIDNRSDLERLLSLESIEFSQISDSALLLQCYLRWGDAFVERVIGDFACAIWDSRESVILLARDRSGMRPLYYAQQSGQLLFASEATAVAAALESKATLNPGRIADFIVQELEGVDFESTFFQEVKRLAPGHCLKLKNQRLRIWEYWKPDPEFELRLGDNEIIEQTRFELSRALEARLRCSDAVGLSLSGGMDSSSLICTAKNLLPEERFKDLHFFSAISQDFDESRTEGAAIEAMLRRFGISAHRILAAETKKRLSLVDRMMECIEDPFDAVLANIALFSFSTASENGVKALIDGIEGDVTFFSCTGCVASLIRQGRVPTALRANWELAAFFDQNPWRRFSHELRALLLPRWDMITLWRQKRVARRVLRHFLEESFLAKSFASDIALENRIRDSIAGMRRFGNRTPREVHASIMHSPTVTAGLERYNRVAAFAQVENRSPLLDQRVVEFCLSLPRRWMVGPLSKPLLRETFGAELPEIVLNRKNFESVAPDFQFRVMKYRREQIFDTISAERSSLAPYIVLKKLDAACEYLNERSKDETPISQQESYRYEEVVYPVWNMYALACWFQRTRALLSGKGNIQRENLTESRETYVRAS